jgi:hypothetical protein
MFEHFAGEVRRGAGAERAVGDFFGLGLCGCDQIGDGAKRRFRIDDDDVGRTRDQRDGRKVLVRIERAAWRSGSD